MGVVSKRKGHMVDGISGLGEIALVEETLAALNGC